MTDYNNFARTFAQSRDGMKWEEIDYFITSYGKDIENKSILDVGCGSGRLLQQFGSYFDIEKIDYVGIDSSDQIIDQAQLQYPQKIFLPIDMQNIDDLKNKKFDFIFFIASFHHLKTIDERKDVLQKVKILLNENGTIFLTNWSLSSELNKKKYEKNIIEGSENQFHSYDYDIKIGKYQRFYHSFSLEELEYLFKQADFDIVENREFQNKRNLISIIKRPSIKRLSKKYQTD